MQVRKVENHHYGYLEDEGWLCQNVTDPTRECAHCSNAGLVVLDRIEPEYGAPCPMCEMGSDIDANPKWWHGPNTTVTEDQHKGFWDLHSARRYSWNGGKTIKHFLCPHCDQWDSKRPHSCAPESVQRANRAAAASHYRRPRFTTVDDAIGKERAGV